MGTSPAVFCVLLLPPHALALSLSRCGFPSPHASCWSSASLHLRLPSTLKLSHLGVTSISPLKTNGLHPPLQAQPIKCAIHHNGLACPCPACLQSKRISTDCPCSRLMVSYHLTICPPMFFSTRRRCLQQCLPPSHHVIMCDDGMRRMWPSCEDGLDESDAALNRRTISLQVGLRDLQRRLHRFLTRCPTHRNGTT